MHSRPALAVLAAVIVALSASALVNHPSAAPSTGSLHGAAHSPPLGHVGGARSIPAPSRPFVHPSIPPPVALTIIFPNGTISNATAPITRDTSTNTYTLTASFIGGILDERNGSTLVGAGKTLTADASLAFAIEVFEASSVNVTGITLLSADEGVFAEGINGLSLANVNASTTSYGVDVEYSSHIALDHVNASNSHGILGYSVSGFTVSKSNVSYTSEGIYVEYGSDVRVTNSTVYSSSDGLYFEYVSNAFLWGVNASETSYGVYLYSVDNAVVAWVQGFGSEYFLYDEYGSGLIVDHASAADTFEPIYTEYLQNVVLDSLNLPFASGDGIYMEYGSGVTITNVSMQSDSGDYALYIYEYTDVSISHLNASGFYYYGAYLEEDAGLSLSNSNFSAGTYTDAYGIYTDYVQNAAITDCSAWEDVNAFVDYGSANLSVTGSDFAHTRGSGYAVYVEYDSNIQLLNNNIYNASDYAVYSYITDGLTLEGNNASWAGYSGLYVEYDNDVLVTQNTFDNATDYALYLYQSTTVQVVDNSFGYLHYLYSYAMEIEECQGLTVEGNTAQHANYSLYLEESSGVVVENNNYSNSYYGMYIYYNSNTTIAGNEFAHDTNAFYLDGGNTETVLYHNNFVSDAGWINDVEIEQLAWADGYPMGGNFWSNHTAPDTLGGAGQNVAGPDGIVDHPFVINATLMDPYPLTAPWTTHTATFTESGLSSGTLWSVAINGATWWSTTSTIVFAEPNGANTTYGYTIGHVEGYHPPSPSTGSITANRGDSTVHVTFTAFNYSVTFHATGLKSGTSWSIVVNGGTLTGTGDIVTTAINGTWAYVPKPVSGYALTTAPGNVTVNGAAATVNIAYVLINNTTNGNGNGNGNSGTTTTSSFSDTEGYGLIGALILALILAVLGFALYARARRPKQPSGAAQWTPPPAGPQPPMPPPGGAPPAGGSPPPGAMGGS